MYESYNRWISEKVAPENLVFFTGTTLKLRFYDTSQPQNYTKVIDVDVGRERRRKGRERKGKKDLSSLFFFILPTSEIVSGRQQNTSCAPVQTLQRNRVAPF